MTRRLERSGTFDAPMASRSRGATRSVRDPLHGAIEIEKEVAEILEHPALQRLRNIKQLGFAEIPYPGASHSRYLHSIGAMWVATRVWESIQRQLNLPKEDAQRIRQLVRVAVLLHDIGHAPMSHNSERLMPSLSTLGLPDWLVGESPERRAHHEDYTLALLLQSSLTPLLEERSLSPDSLAQLVSGRRRPGDSGFVVQHYDLFPLLRQIVSSELDADRMDYLLRDSMYAGVSYGKFDLDWLVRNLVPVEQQGQIFLGLDSRAIFAFEDFLLSRYHMFLSVYYHPTSVCYQEMLLRYYREEPDSFVLPAEPKAYLETDDYALMGALCRSSNAWAHRIVKRRPFSMLLELLQPLSSLAAKETPLPSKSLSSPFRSEGLHRRSLQGLAPGVDMQAWLLLLERKLTQANIAHFRSDSVWSISRYLREKAPQEPSIFVVEETFAQTTPLEEYSPLYRRYAEGHRIVRLFCEPARLEEAYDILRGLRHDLSDTFDDLESMDVKRPAH